MKTVKDLPELNPSSLSAGATYVAARYTSRDKLFRIALARPTIGCDHGTRLCEEKECLASWQYDHVLLFENTVGGRDLISRCGIEGDRRVQIILNAFKDKPVGTFISAAEMVTLEPVEECYQWPAWPIVDRLYLSTNNSKWEIPGIELRRQGPRVGAVKL